MKRGGRVRVRNSWLVDINGLCGIFTGECHKITNDPIIKLDNGKKYAIESSHLEVISAIEDPREYLKAVTSHG